MSPLSRSKTLSRAWLAPLAFVVSCGGSSPSNPSDDASDPGASGGNGGSETQGDGGTNDGDRDASGGTGGEASEPSSGGSASGGGQFGPGGETSLGGAPATGGMAASGGVAATGGMAAAGGSTGGMGSGGTSTGGTMNIPDLPRLVINEVDYDNDGSDTHEFIELYNAHPTDSLDLSGIELILVNGNSSTAYLTLPLSGVVPAGGFFVVASENVTVDPAAVTVRFASSSNAIQNAGAAGDAIVVFDSIHDRIVDMVSFEGIVVAATIGSMELDLVETALPTVSDENSGEISLIRFPDGRDTGDGSADFFATDDVTPGAPNKFARERAGLVINEVDYDQPGSDNAEFIEIFNNSADTFAVLDGVDVVLINGTSETPYFVVPLTGTLAPQSYLVLAAEGLTVSAAATTLRPEGFSVQNGGSDGIALFDKDTEELIDALSYEGALTNATIAGLEYSLVEGTATSVFDNNTTTASLVRLPNGSDTDDASVDWSTSDTPSPGSAN